MQHHELTPKEQKLSDEACAFARSHKRDLIERFAGDEYPAARIPISFFMAGSPGAGKTEFSKGIIKALKMPVLRIDGDEIREMLPGYNGANSSIFQPAISIGVSRLHDYALNKGKSFILDGTFSKVEKARENIRRSLARDRIILIVYIYQNPTVAWGFTQKREIAEGRNISRECFIDEFIAARNVVQTMKDEFDGEVEIYLIDKDLTQNKFDIQFDVTSIDRYIPTTYSKNELENMLPL